MSPFQGERAMLSSYQRTATDDTFGTFYFIARDNGARVQKMRIYSTLVHTLKSFGRAAAFQTLPKTVTQMRTRVLQGADFLNFVQHFEPFMDGVPNCGLKLL